MPDQDQQGASEGGSSWQLLLFPLNVINHVVVILVSVYLVYLCGRDLADRTNQHAVLCTIGYVFLMSEAISALAGENLPTRQLSRRHSIWAHWIMQAVGTVCIFAAIAIKYAQKAERNGSHFRSTHSILGIISVGSLLVVCLSGLPALFAASLRKRIKPVYGKFIHSLLGVTCFVMGMLAQCWGYQKHSMQSKAEGMMVWLTLGTALITVLSLVGALRQLRVHFLVVRKSLFG